MKYKENTRYYSQSRLRLKHKGLYWKTIPMLFFLSALLTIPVFGETQPSPLSPAPFDTPDPNRRTITIDFDNVDIRLFIKHISEITGKNFVIDKSVQGNVTITSPTKISIEDAYRVFESVLEIHGYTTVPAGSVLKILPSARARSQNIEMLESAVANIPEDRVVTQLVTLQHSSPLELKKVLTPLVSETSLIIAHAQSGMLIITETLSNIQKLLSIIELLDVQSREEEIAVIRLTNASSVNLAKILTAIFQNTSRPPKGQVDSAGTIKIVSYERVNALILLANSTNMARIKSIIAMLDTSNERAAGNIHVYYLQNATAVELAKVLTSLPSDQKEDSANKGKTAAISKSVKIMADEETNALIITAERDEYAVLEGVIQKLDIPRRMVYLEALIMEVDVDTDFEVGVEWAAGGSFADDTGQIATGFSGSEGFSLLEGITSEDPTLSSGFSLGVLRQGVKIGDVIFPNIGAILNAYKTDSAINIISTPQILTTDNKQAEISVGENVPYITSRNTTSSDQDYTQYEYRDVATKLAITPHINQSDTLRLEIETEVVRLQPGSTDTPTTYKRTASTTVILKDSETVVIGGIMGQDETESEWKVPLLGDIPLLGWLFKTHSSTSVKTNMFIFITPKIVRNPIEMMSITNTKAADIKSVFPDGESEWLKEKSAKSYFLKVLNVDPQNPFALLNLGIICEKEGDKVKATEMYRNILISNSDAIVREAQDPAQLERPVREIAEKNLRRLTVGQ